ncbi:hypothetical protein [Nonomuraea wenchangensis]|uniref:Uncharacterized protein n=1 Tax=Nonomuraea wenchangensis TaxID=568860 RepID=A0A1I0LTY9_9ACTN|nr:hypothetical protein [Nonomuraea wenchangensis]SEU46700.1 hypothetical protein SAMN05421811_127124 [Nonomuraea wenchangensis]
MVTAVLGVALLLLIKVINNAMKGNRLRAVKFLVGGGGGGGGPQGAPGAQGGPARGPSAAWLPLIKLVVSALAGWCFCSEWFSSTFLQWADFHIGPLSWLIAPILFCLGWLVVDFVDRGGIKPLSNKLAFALPMLIAATHGTLHDWIVYLPSQPDTIIVQTLDAWL